MPTLQIIMLLSACLTLLACGVDRHEVLEGKSCGVAGNCAPGYNCDETSQRCFRDLALVGNTGGSSQAEPGPTAALTADAGDQANGGGEAVTKPPLEAGPQPLLMYTFNGPPGSLVTDESALPPQLDLRVSDEDAVFWRPGQLQIVRAMILSAEGDSTPLITALKQSEALSVELWFIPSDLAQDGPARLLSIAPDVNDQNFMLGLDRETLVRRLRTEADVDVWRGAELVPRLTHLVFTRSREGQEWIYLDGQVVAEQLRELSFEVWDDGFGLSVANEPTGNRPWLGTLDTLAVYDVALTSKRVEELFNVGPR